MSSEQFLKATKLVGRAHATKLSLIMPAFLRHLSSNHPSLILLLVGGGEMESELKQMVKDLDNQTSQHPSIQASQPPGVTASQRLLDRVIFPGRIPHERIPGVYGLIDILAYPRYSMRLTELVTPLKPLEAMAMGKVLVASDVKGHQELIRDKETGFLFPPGDAGALAECLDNLINNDGLCKKDAKRSLCLGTRTPYVGEDDIYISGYL